MEIILILLLLLNVAISLWNAYATGKAWVEVKFAGGWPRFMTWMGAIMAASGLSWCILIIITAAIIHHVATSTPLPSYAQAKQQLQPA